MSVSSLKTPSTICILDHLPLTKKLLTVGEPLSWHKIARIALVILTAIIPPILLTLTVDAVIFLFKKIQAKCVTSNQAVSPPSTPQSAPATQPASTQTATQNQHVLEGLPTTTDPREISLTSSAIFQTTTDEGEPHDLSSSTVFVPQNAANTQNISVNQPKSTGWFSWGINS